MFSLTNLVKSLFEKAKKIRYNANDLSLFDDYGKPAEYGQDFTPRPRIPGQERPNHKYIERKADPKNPGKYIYIYERPDGTRYEETGAEEEQKPVTPDTDFNKHKRQDTPSLFDQPKEEPAGDAVHVPEGDFTPAKARKFAEKNKNLIGDGLVYRFLTSDDVSEENYSSMVKVVQAAALAGGNTPMPYEEFKQKASQYDLEKIDPEGVINRNLEEDYYMPVTGPMLLKEMNKMQIEYDKKHPAAPKAKLIEPEPEEKKDLNAKVQELLDTKQKNKTFKDLNERVSGSRKEAAAIRKLQAEEILKLDNATQYERINKKLVIPEYDPYAAKENGVAAGVVYMNMKLREAITNKPVNDERARQIYVKFTPVLLEEMENAQSLDDIRQIINKYFDSGLIRRNKKTHRELIFNQNAIDKIKELGIENSGLGLTREDHLWTVTDLIVSDIYGKMFTSLVWNTTPAANKHWGIARKAKGTTQEDIDKKRKSLRWDLVNKYRQQMQNIERNIEQMFKYKEQKTIDKLLFRNNILPEEDFRIVRDQPKSNFFDRPEYEQQMLIEKLKDAEKKKIERKLEDTELDKRVEELLADYDTELKPEDWSFLPEKNSGEAKPEEKGEKKRVTGEKQFPKLDRVIRKNGREVTDAEVTVESLHDQFGYQSVQLGNWVKDHEAREHIKHFIASMKDMEDILGIDLKKMNETGGLSIAFGARGKSKSLAHYEPMRKIINLTKTKGDGTIAHEWGHFFDHYLGGAEPDKLQAEGYSSYGIGQNPMIRGVVSELMNEIKSGTVKQVKQFEVPEERPRLYFPNLRSIAQREDLSDALKESKMMEEAKRVIRTNPTLVSEIGEFVAYSLKKPVSFEYDKPNDYFQNSKLTSNPTYWANNQELFARAWEAYIEDKLTENGIYNNYLVAGSKAEEGETLRGRLYPQGEFRARLNKIFDRLIETTKHVYDVAKERDTQTKRVNEIINYNGNESDDNLFNKAIVTPASFKTTKGQRLMKAIRDLFQKAKGRNIKYTADDYMIEFPMDFSDAGDNLFTGMVKDGKVLEPAHSNPNVRRYHRRDEPEAPVTPEEVQKEASEHPGTFKKIQEGQIKTPDDLGEAIATDHSKKEQQPETAGGVDLTDKPKLAAAEITATPEGRLTLVADYNKYKGGFKGKLWLARIPEEGAREYDFLTPISTNARDSYSGQKTYDISDDGVYAYNNYETQSYSERRYFTVKNGKVVEGQNWNMLNSTETAPAPAEDTPIPTPAPAEEPVKLKTNDPVLSKLARDPHFDQGYNFDRAAWAARMGVKKTEKRPGDFLEMLQRSEVVYAELTTILEGTIHPTLISDLGQMNRAKDEYLKNPEKYTGAEKTKMEEFITRLDAHNRDFAELYSELKKKPSSQNMYPIESDPDSVKVVLEPIELAKLKNSAPGGIRLADTIQYRNRAEAVRTARFYQNTFKNDDIIVYRSEKEGDRDGSYTNTSDTYRILNVKDARKNAKPIRETQSGPKVLTGADELIAYQKENPGDWSKGHYGYTNLEHAKKAVAELSKQNPDYEYIIYQAREAGQEYDGYQQMSDTYEFYKRRKVNKSIGKTLFKSAQTGIMHRPQAGTVKDGKVLEPSFKNPSVMRYHKQNRQAAGPEPTAKEEDRTTNENKTSDKPSFEEQWAAIKRYSKEVEPVIADYIKQALYTQGGYGIMNQEGTRVDTIGRDTRDPSRWKTATFINGEASGDVEYTDINRAVKEFMRDTQNSIGPIGSEKLERFYNEAKEALKNKVPQTETRAFNDWFKGSKVTDETGKPLKVFHGTAGDFNQFEYSQDLGFHFGTAEQASLIADDHGEKGAVMPVYLRIENPLELPDIGYWYMPKAVTNILEKKGIISSAEAQQIEKSQYASEKLNKIKKLLISKGYDGIKYENTMEVSGTSYIAFSPNQIKSAIGNTGEFSRYSDDITKSLETQKYPTYGEIDFQGLKIVVENKPGTVRRGTDPDGEKWKTKMFYPYGYIKGTKATDGEAVDVYVGKNRDSEKVFIIHQKDIETKKYDEDKVMLGFDTKESARDAYLAHYDSYEFLGEITEMGIDELKQKIKTRKGKILKSQMKWRNR